MLAHVVTHVRGYSRSEAVTDFAQAAYDCHGRELDHVVTSVFLQRLPADISLWGVDSQMLEGVFRSTRADTASGSLDVLVAELRTQGWDAERLVDALIFLETAHHHRLVLLAASRVARNSPQESEEFLSYGWLGLRTALRKFEPSRGFQFSTYAMTRIVGSIKDGVRDEDPLPKRLVTERNKAMRASQALAESLGRTPTLEELSNEIGEKLAAMLPRLGKAASLEEMEGTFHPADTCDVYADVEASALTEAVDAALDDLPDIQRTLAEAVFRDGMSVRQAASMVGVRQKEAEAMLADAKQVLSQKLMSWV